MVPVWQDAHNHSTCCRKEEDVAQAILAARAGDYDLAITHLEASEELIHELVSTRFSTFIGSLHVTPFPFAPGEGSGLYFYPALWYDRGFHHWR